MGNLRLSRTTSQLIERAVEALERIGRELKRHNDRQECDDDPTTKRSVDGPERDDS